MHFKDLKYNETKNSLVTFNTDPTQIHAVTKFTKKFKTIKIHVQNQKDSFKKPCGVGCRAT